MALWTIAPALVAFAEKRSTYSERLSRTCERIFDASSRHSSRGVDIIASDLFLVKVSVALRMAARKLALRRAAAALARKGILSPVVLMGVPSARTAAMCFTFTPRRVVALHLKCSSDSRDRSR